MSKPTDADLSVRAAAVAELDAKRTPGDWIADDFCEHDGEVRRLGTTDGTPHYYHRTATLAYFQSNKDPEPGEGEAISEPRMKFNCQFAAHAPQMAALVAAQQERLAEKDAEIVRLREALKRYCWHDVDCIRKMSHSETECCTCGLSEALEGK